MTLNFAVEPGAARLGMRRVLLCTMAFLVGMSVHAQFDPAEEQASFRVLPGFEVNLFASEREGVIKPIQIRFDPDGRLWVAGSVTYPQIKPNEPPRDQILVLEDTDHDGRADRSTVFAEGLQIPTGLELGDGGVYVGAGTQLWHLRDTNGDGRADERRVVLRGFGTGDTHQTVNSFTWGPSGELMMSQGLHADSRVETPWGIAELRQAGVWRFWPKTVRLDPFWSGAMGPHNPFGTAFDRWGQPFVFAGNGHGIYHLTQGMIATEHFLEQPSIWNKGRKFGGADFVENGHWPTSAQGEVVSGGYLQNTVERFRLSDQGSTFSAEHLPPLIESTNTAFRIVDVRFGPDGALYLCDWYNPIIGHYQNSFRDPARDKAHGRIWRVTAKDRPLVRWQPLGSLKTPELVARLGSAERWERQMARRVLVERPAVETTEAVRTWLSQVPAGSEALEHARFEALGLMINLDVFDTNLLAQVAQSPEPRARAFAARVVGQWAERYGPNVTDFALGWLGRLTVDPQPRVRLEAVVACSEVPDARAIETAAQSVDLPVDPAMEYAWTQTVQCLRPWWQPAQSRGALRFANNANRLAAFYRAEGGSRSAAEAAARLRRNAEVALDADAIRQLTEVVATAGGSAEMAVLLNPRSFTTGTNYDRGLHARRLREAAESSHRLGLAAASDLTPSVTSLVSNNDPELRAAGWLWAGAWKIVGLRPKLEAVARDPGQSEVERIAAVEGLGFWADPSTMDQLAALGRSAQPESVRAAAIAQQVPLNREAAAEQAAAWFRTPVGPAEVDVIARAFLRQRGGIEALSAAMNSQAPNPKVASVLLEVLARKGRRDPALDKILRAAVSTGTPAHAWSLADADAIVRSARTGGDRTRGQKIFESPSLACTTCHSVGGAGGKVGPDLGALGTAQTLEFVVGAILDPQKEVKEGFMAYEVVTKDGSTYQGYLRGETPTTLTLQDHLTQQRVTLPRSEIAAQRQLGSLMPSGLLDGLSAQELQDLVIYLANLGRK